MPRNLIIVTCSLFYSLFHFYFLFHFVGHIYAMVSPRNNSWGFDYWLAHCLNGKQPLLELVTDDENNEFLTGLMVSKGKYLTLASHKKRRMGTYIRIIGWYLLYTT